MVVATGVAICGITLTIHVYVIVVYSNAIPSDSNIHPSCNMEFTSVRGGKVGVDIYLLRGSIIAYEGKGCHQ